jgi:hypothetical protein
LQGWKVFLRNHSAGILSVGRFVIGAVRFSSEQQTALSQKHRLENYRQLRLRIHPHWMRGRSE